MAYQYMPKMFHDTHETLRPPLPPPPTYLMYGPLNTLINLCISATALLENS